MLNDIKKIKAQFHTASNQEELSAIRTQMKDLFEKDAATFGESMLECIKESNQKADEILLKQKLENILPII